MSKRAYLKHKDLREADAEMSRSHQQLLNVIARLREQNAAWAEAVGTFGDRLAASFPEKQRAAIRAAVAEHFAEFNEAG
jgi:hypothetical protein